MYDIIYGILDHAYTSGDNIQSYVLYTCCTLIVILTVTFIDLIYRIFGHFWRG